MSVIANIKDVFKLADEEVTQHKTLGGEKVLDPEGKYRLDRLLYQILAQLGEGFSITHVREESKHTIGQASLRNFLHVKGGVDFTKRNQGPKILKHKANVIAALTNKLTEADRTLGRTLTIGGHSIDTLLPFVMRAVLEADPESLDYAFEQINEFKSVRDIFVKGKTI
jgi:hypothetical protein